jgi:hypothetical protein
VSVSLYVCCSCSVLLIYLFIVINIFNTASALTCLMKSLKSWTQILMVFFEFGSLNNELDFDDKCLSVD